MEAAKKRRICLMDELRGFAVFCMVFYHGFYTLAFLYNSEFGMYWLRFFSPAEPWFAGLFILISGVSSNLTHSNLIRGVKLAGVALAVTLVTAVMSVWMPGNEIWFGILHFLAVCMILFGLGQKLSKKSKSKILPGLTEPWRTLIPLAGCTLLAALTWGTSTGHWGLFGWKLALPLPANDWLAPFGFVTEQFRSADYFPLLPWVFVFFGGTVLGRLAAAGKLPEWAYPSRVPILQFMGKHALIIYIVHQPLIYGLGMLIQMLIPR